MGAKTKIEWCDASWSPVTGCLHGCKYCYAKRLAEHYGGKTDTETAVFPVLENPLTKTRNGKYSNKEKINPYPYGFTPTFHKYRLDTVRHWTKPKNIFVCSMADLFGEWVPDEWIEEVFATCKERPQHRYIFLTKNPKRLGELASKGVLPKGDNYWWGSTLDNKNAKRFPGRITDHTFLSIEPLTENMDVGLGSFGSAEWIIIGAETGNRKGKVTPHREWVENICKAADLTQAAVFMKDSLLPIMGEKNMRREFPWQEKAR